MNIDEEEILRMALIGYGLELVKIQDQIDSVKIRLAIGSKTETLPVGPGGAKWPVKFIPRERLGRRRRLSPEGRARIIAATKKRWARVRREKSRKGGRG